MMLRLRDLCTSVALLLAVAASAQAEGTQTQQKPIDPYVPGLGDFMTAYVQPHHTKLGLAGAARNWPLAAYEANELRETFEDVSTYQGTWHDLPIAKMLDTMLVPKLKEVDQAIAIGNDAAFKAAFDRLTEGCNACHKAAAHPFLVIKSPTADSYPDQDFAPH